MEAGHRPLSHAGHEPVWGVAKFREMERDGIVARKVYHQVRPKVEYSLTAYGQTLRPVLRELCK